MKKFRFVTAIIALALILTGCLEKQGTETDIQESVALSTVPMTDGQSASGQRLHFSVVESEEQTRISKEELGGKTDVYLAYGNLAEVNILLDGQMMPFAQAIGEEKLSIPEVFAWAQMDARNGFCKESFASKNGLAHFTYEYPECALWLAHDVYETPDGEQTLIEELYIYKTGNNRDIQSTYVDQQSEWGYFLDREDWGLTFTVSGASPTGITVDYAKERGQEIGSLTLDDYMLFARKEDGSTEYLGSSGKTTAGLPITIEGDGQFTLDWSDQFSPLESGDYFLKVTVSDHYEEADLHPLMVNYYDRQSYHIAFTID